MKVPLFNPLGDPRWTPLGIPSLNLCTPPPDNNNFIWGLQLHQPLKRGTATKNSLAIIILAILGNYEDPLKGPLGANIIYFLELYILPLNIVQSRPIPRFFINPLIRFSKNKVSHKSNNSSHFCDFCDFRASYLLLKTCGHPGEIDKKRYKNYSIHPLKH